jgi:APA family basic amino acid/polyamine antiporter
MDVFRTKSIEQSIEDTEEPEHKLHKTLSAWDLTVFGVGVIIGTGIFVLTGVAAATKAGPAIALSFVLAGIACALAALCYAEFASTVPVAGSAYTFSYASLGELLAWIIGWDLVLEFALGAATVAVGWSSYFTGLLGDLGIDLPKSIAGDDPTVNLPAALIVVLLTVVAILGVKLSSRVNATMVVIKLSVVLLFIVAGAFYIKTANWDPFIPPAAEAPKSVTATDTGGTPLIQVLFGLEPLDYGLLGIAFGAAIVFFAYIGFDVVATTAEEARRPQRDMPIGILGSLAICTVLYVAVSLVLTGIAKYTELNVADPMAEALRGVGLDWAAGLVSVGAIAGLTTVVLILLMGQNRVLFAMSRDGLLPTGLAKVHPRFRTPWLISAITGGVVALMAALIPLEVLAELVNIGTLFAFVLVSIGVLVLRRTQPDLPRAFRTPAVPLVPILAVLSCLFLMLNLEDKTWERFLLWLVPGLLIYFLYGRTHNRLARESRARPEREGRVRAGRDR